MKSLILLAILGVDFWPEDSADFVARTSRADHSQSQSQTQILWFTAKWCGPCQQFSRDEVPKLAAKSWTISTGESALIRVVDADANEDLVSKYQVSELPCFVRIQDGRETARLSGYQQAGDVTDLFYQRTFAAALPVAVNQVSHPVQQQQIQWVSPQKRRKQFLFFTWE